MPKRTLQESLETRDRILKEAIAELSERGYDSLSLESLAKQSGVTRGAVYHHFKNKEGLFLQAFEKVSQEMGEIIMKWASSGPSGGEDIREALILGTEGFLIESQKPEYQRIILTDAPGVLGMEKWQEIDDEYTTSTLVQAFSGLLGEDSTLNAHAMAQAFSGAMNQLSRWVSSDKDREDALKLLTEMMDRILPGSK